MKKNDDASTTQPTIRTRGPAPQWRPTAALVVILGAEIGQRIDVLDEPIIIGRSVDCDLRIQHPSVSRKHCRVWRVGDSYRIRDLQSTNKTYLNDVSVVEAELKDGDSVTIGETILKFVGRASVEARYHDELYQLATHDALTGLNNRRQFRNLLDHEVVRATSGDHPLCLAILDVDHFKQINDGHGHDAGDQVLLGLAGVLHALPWQDLATARIGGEEFGLMFSGRSLTDSARLCEELRRSIEEQPPAFAGGSKVTISVGVSAWSSEMRTSGDLLRAADIQLYRAKAGGRNRVCRSDG